MDGPRGHSSSFVYLDVQWSCNITLIIEGLKSPRNRHTFNRLWFSSLWVWPIPLTVANIKCNLTTKDPTTIPIVVCTIPLLYSLVPSQVSEIPDGLYSFTSFALHQMYYKLCGGCDASFEPTQRCRFAMWRWCLICRSLLILTGITWFWCTIHVHFASLLLVFRCKFLQRIFHCKFAR